MTQDKQNFILYLEDMLQSMERIHEYLGDMDFRHFKMNNLVVDAIIRNFQIIGEASKNIPEGIKNKYP
jgi:uncharacterized protein with HEPN domain